MYNHEHPAVVFGLSETGLSIGRSLRRMGIIVYGISFTKEIGYYSKKINGLILPNPISDTNKFSDALKSLCSTLNKKPVLFIASDLYLDYYTKNSALIKELFLANLPSADLTLKIQDKYSQFHLAKEANIDVPLTYFIENDEDYENQIQSISLPVFIKARDVNLWRKEISSIKKGYVVYENKDLEKKIEEFRQKKVPIIIQELIKSPDSKNFKVCVNIAPSGQVKQLFTLRKIHQKPANFGIGTSVESISDRNLAYLGTKLFKAISYKGVGSAEFKFDEKDNRIKLIEINSRYWQQNAQADHCGMNFPYCDYLIATNQNPKIEKGFRVGIKYVNLFSDFDSFLESRKQSGMTFMTWRKEISGNRKLAFLFLDDPRIFTVHLYRYILRRLSKLKRKLF